VKLEQNRRDAVSAYERAVTIAPVADKSFYRDNAPARGGRKAEGREGKPVADRAPVLLERRARAAADFFRFNYRRSRDQSTGEIALAIGAMEIALGLSNLNGHAECPLSLPRIFSQMGANAQGRGRGGGGETQ